MIKLPGRPARARHRRWRRERPFTTVENAMPRDVVDLRVKKHLDMPDVVSAGALKIRRRRERVVENPAP